MSACRVILYGVTDDGASVRERLQAMGYFEMNTADLWCARCRHNYPQTLWMLREAHDDRKTVGAFRWQCIMCGRVCVRPDAPDMWSEELRPLYESGEQR